MFHHLKQLADALNEFYYGDVEFGNGKFEILKIISKIEGEISCKKDYSGICKEIFDFRVMLTENHSLYSSGGIIRNQARLLFEKIKNQIERLSLYYETCDIENEKVNTFLSLNAVEQLNEIELCQNV